MTTDTSERGLERLICTALTGSACDPGTATADTVRERPAAYGAGWICGDASDYDREYCVDFAQLAAFLRATQPDVCEAYRTRLIADVVTGKLDVRDAAGCLLEEDAGPDAIEEGGESDDREQAEANDSGMDVKEADL